MARLRLSAAFQNASGALGELVIAQARGGIVARRRPRYRRPTAPSQEAAMERFAAANAVWNSLTAAQVQAWRDYAEQIVRRNAVSGASYRGTAHSEFIALAVKFLQASPGGSVPIAPPSSSYIGDQVVVSVALSLSKDGGAMATPSLTLPLGEGGGNSDGGAGQTPSLTLARVGVSTGDDRRGQSLGEGGGNSGGNDFASTDPSPLTPLPQSGEGNVVWTASGANDADTATELLVQKLPNPRRKPTKQYTSAAFVQFDPGGLSYEMPLDAGTYAFAYRFVRMSTGQATLLIPCGVVTIEETAALAA